MGGPAVPALNNEVMPVALQDLSDAEFMRQFDRNADVEHVSNINTLHFLNELERRKLFLDLGYSSAFDYCVRNLKCSSSAAGRQIQAARCIRRHPEFLDLLRDRDVCVTTLAFIEPILTDDNKNEILHRVRGASRREVERLVSEYRPSVGLRDRIRFVQLPAPVAGNIDTALFERQLTRGSDAPVCQERWSELQRVYVQFLADQEFLELFEEVQALMSNQGAASFSEIMKTVLTEYRDRHSPAARQKRRVAKRVNGAASIADAGRTGANGPDSHRWEWKKAQVESSRHIPDETRDEVFVRDKGRCSFVAPDGTPCECRKGLQIDHIRPYAAGGTHEPHNLRLLCGAHNRLAAERTLGKHVMQLFWRRQ